MNTYNNPILQSLPLHLKQYVVEQHYQRYTPIDHAIWRYVMRQNYSYLKDVAYYPYIPGLKKAGLTIEKIPNLQTMNDHLRKLGWGAVTVSGFIPPLAFMEFQAHRVLVIAADIRQLDHIEYTPAPDIIHESSGHAPIIAEPDYAAYLQYFGSIGSKAMFSARDFELYEAIRLLSILKEQAGASAEEISAAEENLERIQNDMGEPSEMALLSRLHWWTVEYGLIGTVQDPKIYGAGLLSSIGESASCMKKDVLKIPYSLDAVNYPYDITKPQPQLFVTPDFQTLLDVLEEFSTTMAFRKGGQESLQKAIECKNVCTVMLSSGIEVSGVFVQTDNIKEGYLKTEGPTALSYNGKQLVNHGKTVHSHGFSSPFGKLEGISKPLEEFSTEELHALVSNEDDRLTLHFENQIQVTGRLISRTEKAGKTILLSFSECTVCDKESGTILFRPEWGSFDLAVGTSIVSVYSGAADKEAFEQVSFLGTDYAVNSTPDAKTAELQRLYGRIRKLRAEGIKPTEADVLWSTLKDNFPSDWLAPLELLEVLFHFQTSPETQNEIRAYLTQKARTEEHYTKLITDGLDLIGKDEIRLVNE